MARNERSPAVQFGVGVVVFVAALVIAALLSIDDVEGAEMPPPTEGVGSCYEIKPLCLGGGRPVCMCTITQQCYWVCK